MEYSVEGTDYIDETKKGNIEIEGMSHKCKSSAVKIYLHPIKCVLYTSP